MKKAAKERPVVVNKEIKIRLDIGYDVFKYQSQNEINNKEDSKENSMIREIPKEERLITVEDARKKIKARYAIFCL